MAVVARCSSFTPFGLALASLPDRSLHLSEKYVLRSREAAPDKHFTEAGHVDASEFRLAE